MVFQIVHFFSLLKINAIVHLLNPGHNNPAEPEKKSAVMLEDSIDQQPQQLEVDEALTTSLNERKDSSTPEGLRIVKVQHISDPSKQIVIAPAAASSPLPTMSNSLAIPSTSSSYLAVPSTSSSHLAVPSTSKSPAQTPPTNGAKNLVRRRSRTDSPLSVTQINLDDIVSQIKISIAKTIEDKVYQEKSYILGGKAFELPKKEEGSFTEEDKSKIRGECR